MQWSVEQELQVRGKPSPQSIVDFVKHARKPNNSTARAISETNCPPASAKHVTCYPLINEEERFKHVGHLGFTRGHKIGKADK